MKTLTKVFNPSPQSTRSLVLPHPIDLEEEINAFERSGWQVRIILPFHSGWVVVFERES